jgi:Zn finger protein HypA/HybF involved in hydrogenase expression
MNGAHYANVTLADLTSLVIDAVEVSCHACGMLWRAPYQYLPLSTSLQTMATLLICPTCGGREIHVAPARACGSGPGH